MNNIVLKMTQYLFSASNSNNTVEGGEEEVPIVGV